MKTTADPHLTDQERRQTIELLEQTREEFLRLTKALSPTQWTTAPQEGAWSVALTAEHLVISEMVTMRLIKRITSQAPDPDWEEKTAGRIETLQRILPSRARRAPAPESVVPQGRIAVPELIERFLDTRRRTIEFAASTELPLKQHTAAHPFPVFGVMNGHQWLILIPLHNLRHNLQIAEALEKVGG